MQIKVNVYDSCFVTWCNATGEMKKLNGGQNKHIKLSKVGAEQAVSSDYLSTTANQYNSFLSNPIFGKVIYFLYFHNFFHKIFWVIRNVLDYNLTIFRVVYGDKNAFISKFEEEEDDDLFKPISSNEYKYSFVHDSSDGKKTVNLT